jgi:activator of HSP90 ATPase
MRARIAAQLPTRRQLLWKSLALGAGLTLGKTATAIAADPSAPHIHQEVDFKVNPVRIYEALLDEKQFSAFTGAAAQIKRELGGAFTLFGGRVIGRNVELMPNRRLVQAWRVETWPSGIYSNVKFELSEESTGTHIVFDHTGFPPEDQQTLSANWPKFYWDPLRQYLGV